MKTFVIAEAGVNHNGDENLALALVDAAAKSGADAVKFQTFSADKLTRKGVEKAEYQKQGTGDGDQHGMLRALEMSESLHRRLFAHCRHLGIEFMSTAFDEDALDFLIDLGIKRIKVPSGEITNVPLLTRMASKGLPLIISTGMAELSEVVAAVDIIGSARAARGFVEPLTDVVTILHCTSNYPTAIADVNLRAMRTMAGATGLPVGYSDHTLGLAVATGAVALGATVIEKHFTLDTNLPGPDHKASLEPAQLGALVQQIRDMEVALGSAVKAPTASELPIRDLVRRSVTTLRSIAAGTTVGKDDVALLRPGTGIPPIDLEKVIGRKSVRHLAAGETISWSDIV
ncbi:N-acetylneuraminate synthase [Bradyrhizobium sp. KBS0727]|uniref:N-acetylneuraminate synthase n=1 Tax=unclassified Bradyrhizobium TaxID=2631580 RepID=UPI00110D41A4|nr:MULTISPECIES: N-acetylneuraminate synthase [unclassified Bradyrhizobium]QDW39803.1 N-acetylneuraminate synthase [Bradyrhizobium sp. KBS0725]QDW46406.1 N-acetylneuraminate synthase [Bradyrhizobium sp. KBS0727]